MSEQKQPQPVKVRITREQGHKHAGLRYAKGDELAVPPRDAAFIVERKIGELIQEGK